MIAYMNQFISILVLARRPIQWHQSQHRELESSWCTVSTQSGENCLRLSLTTGMQYMDCSTTSQSAEFLPLENRDKPNSEPHSDNVCLHLGVFTNGEWNSWNWFEDVTIVPTDTNFTTSLSCRNTLNNVQLYAREVLAFARGNLLFRPMQITLFQLLYASVKSSFW